MHAIVQNNYAPDYNFSNALSEETDFPIPVPNAKKKQVLVQIVAAASNPLDYRLCHGGMRALMSSPMPFVIGRDFSGIVHTVPEAIAAECDLKVGDRVCGYQLTGSGSFAEFIAAPYPDLVKVPAEIPLLKAAALPLVASTTYGSLVNGLKFGTDAKSQAGKSFLVLGGSTATGLLALAMARATGCTRIIATSTSQDLCMRYGATEVIDYKQQDWVAALAGAQLDYVFDTVEGYSGWMGAQKVLKKNGAYSAIVGDDPKMDNITKWNLVKMGILLFARRIKSIFCRSYSLMLKLPQGREPVEYFMQLSLMKMMDIPIDGEASYRFCKEDALEMFSKHYSKSCKGKLVMKISDEK